MKPIEFQSKRYKMCQNLMENERLKKIIQLVQSEPKGKLLEVGCLDGTLGEFFLKKGWVVFGCDYSKEIEKAKAKGIKCKKFDFEKRFPYKNNFFDGVIAGEIIEHLFDTQNFLKEIFRILKPNGFLIISTPNTAALFNRIAVFFGKKPLNLDFDMGGGHIRAYTLDLLRKQLIKTGFKIEKQGADLLRLSDKIEFNALKKIESFLAEIFPTLSMNLIIKARKVEKKVKK